VVEVAPRWIRLPRHPAPRLGWAVAAVCLVAAGLALTHLGRAPLWRDEAWSVAVSGRSVAGTLHVVATRETNMGLYYLLLNLWLRAGGTGEAWVRALSVIPALATLPVVAAIVRRLVPGAAPAALAALLLAVNPFFLTYAREARAYSLALLLTALATLLFLRALERPSVGTLTSYAVVLVAAEYTQLLAVLVLCPHLLALARRGLLRSRRWLSVYAGAALAVAPLAVAVALNRHNQAAWIPRLRGSTLTDFATALAGSHPLLLAESALAAVALVAVWRRRDRLASVTVYAAVGVLAPVALVAVVSLRVPLFVDRYLIPVLPPLVLLLVLGLVRLAGVRVWVAALAAAALVLGSVAVDARIVRTREKVEDLRAAAGWVRAEVCPGDALLYAPAWARVGFERYAGTGRPAGADDVALAPHGSGVEVGDVMARELPAAVVDQRLAGHPRVWVVGYPHDSWTISPEPALTLLAEHRGDWALLADRTFGDVDVRLYASVPPQARG